MDGINFASPILGSLDVLTAWAWLKRWPGTLNLSLAVPKLWIRSSQHSPAAGAWPAARQNLLMLRSSRRREMDGWLLRTSCWARQVEYIGIPSLPPTDAPACVRVLHLTAYRLRYLQRFHEKHRFGQVFVTTQRCKICKVCGLDCTKMWPWMRDLPTISHWGWLWLGFWREHSPAALICRWQPCYAKCRKCRSLGIRGSSCRGGETCGRKNQWSPSRNGCFPESSLICWGAEICLHQKCGEAKWCSKCQGHMMAVDGLEGPIPRDSIGVRWSAERSMLCREKVGPGLTEAQANAALEAMAFPSPRRRRLRPRCYTQQWIGSNGRSSGMPIAGLVVCSKISGWSPKTTRRRSWSAPSKLPWRGGRSRRKRRRRKGRPWSLRRSLERSSESECCKMPQIRYCTDHLNRGKSFALLGIHFPFVCGLKVEVNHVQLLICWRPRQIQRLILPHTMVHSL